MQIAIIGSLSEVSAAEWNALVFADNPFARHEFLSAMERHNAVGKTFGWYPQYLLARDNGELVGAAPMYLKDNSYGELVFDWAWADAYKRSGVEYYPKLVVAIPYTPASGQRLLVHPKSNYQTVAQAMINAATEHARNLNVSSLHWLFTNEQDTALFKNQPEYMLRLGCQFHWHNQGYQSFDDYLSHFSSSKRKKIRQERRRVKDQGISLEILHGDEASQEQWETYHRFYNSTFDRKYGYATFSQGFFLEIAETMPRNIVLVLAKHQDEYVAGAFNLRGSETLYGRHWGCSHEFHSLHFEACYYQGLEYCINNGMQRFEPGAQGEHKIARGFLPAKTWSAHWIADERFKTPIKQFLQHETGGMEHYIAELHEHSPFKIK
ncbi:MAG: GNAT family N-acetyltransferase [Gammaproteobacteria bacterium]|nr:GNAT family N-acetyltransferase [Gammaproteobacteria bacterium]